ncbi:MAG: lysophospholipase [Clostridia bacterium]|nr:lysophospholipase [Clostridia bacterium]
MKETIKKEEFYYPSADGKHTIHALLWKPSQPRGVVQIAHGVSEYADRYDAYARFLCSRGYAVAAADHLGHGESIAKEEDRCFFAEKNGWETVCTDLLKLTEILKARFEGLPCFLLGHSMGSFLARTVICTHSQRFNGLILSGTGHQNGATVFFGKRLAEWIGLLSGARHKSPLINALAFGPYSKPFQPVRTPFDWISSDPAEVDAYIADEKCGQPITVGLFLDMLNGFGYIKNQKNLSKIRKELPIFIYSGDMDPVGGMGKGVQKVYDMYKAAGLTDLHMIMYEDGRHEMHNEPNRAEVMQAVADWLDTYC